MTCNEAQRALDAANHNVDVAYYDACHGIDTKEAHEAACALLWEAENDLINCTCAEAAS